MHLGVTWLTCHLDNEGYFLDISKLKKYEEEISRGLVNVSKAPVILGQYCVPRNNLDPVFVLV